MPCSRKQCFEQAMCVTLHLSHLFFFQASADANLSSAHNKDPHALQFSPLHLFLLHLNSYLLWKCPLRDFRLATRVYPPWKVWSDLGSSGWQNKENILYRLHFATCLTSWPCAVSRRSTDMQSLFFFSEKMWNLNDIPAREPWQLSVLQPSEWAGLDVNNGCLKAE